MIRIFYIVVRVNKNIALLCDSEDFMEESNYKKNLHDLRNARHLKKNWYIVATLTENIRESIDGPKRKSERLGEAARASGFNINTLNRMLGVKIYYESVKKNVPDLENIDPNNLSFPSLEVIKRWHQLDPEIAKTALLEVIAERITYRVLREKYNLVVASNTSSASAHQVARLVAKDFKEAAMEAVKKSIKLLVSEIDPIIRSSGGDAIASDALIFRQNAKYPIAGIEFLLIREQAESKNSLEDTLHRIVFNAGFYDCYWIVFASTIGQDRVEAFCKILDELDRSSIGVAILPWKRTPKPTCDSPDIEIMRNALENPNPDWRNRRIKFESMRNFIGKIYLNSGTVCM
jgi:hypothetical protein